MNLKEASKTYLSQPFFNKFKINEIEKKKDSKAKIDYSKKEEIKGSKGKVKQKS